MWFITSVDPNLQVRVSDKRVIRFTAAEYRTDDPDELAALRADPRVQEVVPASQAPARTGFVLNANTGELHDLSRADTRCHIPDDVETALGWKTYKRRSDAIRWNCGLEYCGFCMREV